MPAPIVLFVYNRPLHTLQTLEALGKNELADQSALYIFADGPKQNATAADIEGIQNTRNIINSKNWCGTVTIFESTQNKGLADSIVAGVTQIIDLHGSVIVLEDDIVTSSGFLQFMNSALERYAPEEKVMHIAGYMFPVKQVIPDLFFTKIMFCWGWATWARAWKHFNPDTNAWMAKLNTAEARRQFDLTGAMDYYTQLEQNAKGILKTWAIKWYAAIYFQQGLCLTPAVSMVQNIGTDGTGENCDATNIFDVSRLQETITLTTIPIIDNASVTAVVKEFQHSAYNKSSGNQKQAVWLKYLKASAPGKFFSKLKSKTVGVLSGRWAKNRQEQHELKRLRAYPRFTPATTNLLGKKLAIIDAASFVFIYDEVFKTEIYRFKSTTKTPYIVDCGANIGLSVLYFKQLYPRAQIVAFEPDQKVFEALKKNVDSFGSAGVTLVNKACWNTETTLRFYSEGADGGRAAKDFDTTKIVEVETVRLKSFLHQQVDFLKIDIEGAENEVIPDIKEELKNVQRIFVEFHSFVGKEQMMPEILTILKEAGFRITIHHIGICSPNPYMSVLNWNNMDMQLNIYGYRP